MSPLATDTFDRAHNELSSLLRGGAIVVLPVNPIEYHGPHLPLTNDAVVTRGLGAELQRALTDLSRPWVTLPDLGLGTNPVPGPGSRATHPAVLRAVLLDACNALVDLGATRVVLLTFHGDPIHNLILDDGVRLLRSKTVRAIAPMHLLLREMMAPDVTRLEAVLAYVPKGERRRMRDELRFDVHAGFAETSLTLHFAPEVVSPRHRDLPPCPTINSVFPVAALSWAASAVGRQQMAAELDFAAKGLGWFGLDPFPGYTGRPNLARAEAGSALAELIVEGLAPEIRAVLERDAPPPVPVMRWLRWAPTRLARVGR